MGILVTGALCEYAEDFVIDNYISAIKKRGKGIPALAYENDVVSQISTSLNFMILHQEYYQTGQTRREEI